MRTILACLFGLVTVAGCYAVDSSSQALCGGKTNGATCGDQDDRVCINGTCTASRCGDGYVDLTTNEECDDYNLIPYDGCEPTCQFTCDTDEECQTGGDCDGTEHCILDINRCQAGEPAPDGTDCTIGDDIAGRCIDATCVPASCGNGQVETGEHCDDGQNGDDDDGCTDACAFTCLVHSDCGGDVCAGGSLCESSSHTCAETPPADCDDGDPCTTDSCNSLGCQHPLLDNDGDGFAPAGLECTDPNQSGDCNDDSALQNPGLAELCDTEKVDNDCNPSTTEDDCVPFNCHRDADSDGFLDEKPESENVSGACPAGTYPPSGAGFDCNDSNDDVFPGQAEYFAAPYGGHEWDYDCSGSEEPEWPTVNDECWTTPAPIDPEAGDEDERACESEGWLNSVPSCGHLGSWLKCMRDNGGVNCFPELTYRTQRCH